MHASYSDYLRSSHWARLKKAYRSRNPWVCICGEREGLQLHHKTYERLGRECDEDLRPLCAQCHSALHDLAKAGGSLNPDEMFSSERALSYLKTRTDLASRQRAESRRQEELVRETRQKLSSVEQNSKLHVLDDDFEKKLEIFLNRHA